MTRSLENSAELSVPEAKVLRDIQTYGWHVTKFFGTGVEAGPEWAFSIGLFHSYCHPEVIIFGLKLDICIALVHEIGGHIKTGKEYDVEGEYGDILRDPYKCAFRFVQPYHDRDYLGYGCWFYQSDPFPTLQCFWPDKTGRFPWDEGCVSTVRDAQPLLYVA
jgi:Domain of unknown function (DUF4262)